MKDFVMMGVRPNTRDRAKALAALEGKKLVDYLDETFQREAEKRGILQKRYNERFF